MSKERRRYSDSNLNPPPRNIINLTPHEIVLKREYLPNLVFPPSGEVARVKTKEQLKDYINKTIPIYENRFEEIEGLPSFRRTNPVFYIVSFIVYKAAEFHRRNTRDLIVPNTAPTEHGAVRDENGNIIAVQSFQRPK